MATTVPPQVEEPLPAKNEVPCVCGCKLTADDPRHGTANGYGNLKCRCQPCRDAHAEKCLERRKERVKRGLAPDAIQHGTPNGYGNWGCRCTRCKKAWAQRSAESRAGLLKAA